MNLIEKIKTKIETMRDYFKMMREKEVNKTLYEFDHKKNCKEIKCVYQK